MFELLQVLAAVLMMMLPTLTVLAVTLEMLPLLTALAMQSTLTVVVVLLLALLVLLMLAWPGGITACIAGAVRASCPGGITLSFVAGYFNAICPCGTTVCVAGAANASCPGGRANVAC